MKIKLKNRTLYTIAAYLAMCFFFSFSQNSTEVDSLETVLQTTKEDSTRISTLNKLAWKLKYSNPDTAIYYSKQGLSSAEQIGWKKGIALSHFHLGEFNRLKGNYSLALDHYSKALKIREELEHQKSIAGIISVCKKTI